VLGCVLQQNATYVRAHALAVILRRRAYLARLGCAYPEP